MSTISKPFLHWYKHFISINSTELQARLPAAVSVNEPALSPFSSRAQEDFDVTSTEILLGAQCVVGQCYEVNAKLIFIRSRYCFFSILRLKFNFVEELDGVSK